MEVVGFDIDYGSSKINVLFRDNTSIEVTHTKNIGEAISYAKEKRVSDVSQGFYVN